MAKVTIGELLRRYRLEAAYKQTELAELMGYHHSMVSRAERNQYVPSEAFLNQFFAALAIPEAEQKQFWDLLNPEPDTKPPGPPGKIDWGTAPDVSIFYGRSQDLTHLAHWITTEQCRLVGILGMGGIGKTTLVTRLAQQVELQFQYVIWRSLTLPPSAEELVVEFITLLSDQSILNLPQNLEAGIRQLIDLLRRHRCLLILDNFESVLQEAGSSKYLEGYNDYGRLISQIGSSSHQSCVLLTSREKPRELSLLEGLASPSRAYPLSGLDEAASQSILHNKGVTGEETAKTQLVQFYSGNPLALAIASEMIREVYNGEIREFLNDDTAVFGRIQDILQEQFNRLSSTEQDIMYWLAIEQEPISLAQLDEVILHTPKSELMTALNSLIRRSLMEKTKTGFTLQNVVMQFVIDHFVNTICPEIHQKRLVYFKSHALIKADAKEHIRQTQIRLILDKVITQLKRQHGSKTNIEAHLKDVLATLRTSSGYAAGNVLNLLIRLNCSLAHYDLSRLTIRQACLQEVALHNVNLSYARLQDNTFTEPFGHVLCLAITPDGERFAAATAEGNIHIWQTADSRPIQIWQADTNWVRAIAFSPDSKTLISGSSGTDKPLVKLWDAHTGQHLKTLLGHTNRIRSVAFSPNGQLAASGSEDNTVRLWYLQEDRCLHVLQSHTNAVWSVAFSPNEQWLASGGADHTVQLWQVANGKLLTTFSEHEDWVSAVAFNPDSTLMASGSRDQTIRLWHLPSRRCIHILQGHTAWVRTVAFHPEGSLLASGSGDHTIRLWDTQTGQCVKVLQGHNSLVESLTFTPNGKQLISGSAGQSIRLWDVETGKCLRTIRGYTNPMWSVAFHPHQDIVAAGSSDGRIRLWHPQTNERLHRLKGHHDWAKSIAFSPDGDRLVSGSSDKTLRLWHTQTETCLQTLEGHTNWISLVAYSPNGRLIASSSGDHTVRLWHGETGQSLHTLEGHTSRVWAVVFNPMHPHLLASSGDDHTIRLWDTTTTTCLRTLKGHSGSVFALAFSPDGATIISGSSDKTLRWWDTATGQCKQVSPEYEATIWSIACHPQEDMMAVSLSDHTIRLLTIQSGQPLKTLTGHTKPVWSVAFHPQGEVLASCGDDETIRLWYIPTGYCFNTIRANRPYEQMNITGTKGLTPAQKQLLQTLGAIKKGVT